ncbi:MAG: beta-galactosidase, partial [Pseudomonadota bacterium]
DAKRMVDLGLGWVRIGEFAWSRIEPEPDQFDWSWLDRAVNTLTDAGLKIVMGTPTATPPRWMLDRHPDMLAVDKDGRPRKFGSRRHYCFSHLGYRAQAAKIAGLMARRYGTHPGVQAWQTDNEYGCHDTTLSYSDAARTGFRDWLAEKYQSPDALNRAWGNVFWSMEYRSFDEVDLPNLTVTEANPAHLMDFRRYTSDQVVAFNRAQVDAIRAHSDADIIHNYMGRETDFDHFEMGEDLEVASWDSYPLGFLEDRLGADEDHKSRYAQQGDPDFQAFHHDLYRAVGKGRWWIMEQQPGPVNWAPYNPAPAQGLVALWAIEAAAHGAETVCYFRWRQAPFAQEQMHAGLLRPDSKPALGWEEAAAANAALNPLGEIKQVQADVALVFDYPSQWAWEIQPQSQDFDYFQLVFDTYRGLRRLGLSVDIIPARANAIKGYKMILVPGLFALSEAFQSALQQSNAHIVYGPRTNSKTPDFSIPQGLAPNLGLDFTVAHVETLRPGMIRPLETGHAHKWVESLETSETVDLRTKDGHPVLISKGSQFYLGAWLDDRAIDEMLTLLCDKAGIETQNLPGGLRVRDTATHRFWINYETVDVTFNGQSYAPCSVHIAPR